MSEILSTPYTAKHGETAWTLSGQQKRLTDLPLAEGGQNYARRLGNHLDNGPLLEHSQVHCVTTWYGCDRAAIAALGLLSYGITLMRLRWMLVQIHA
jgi:Histidine phosphatase superfamily (branch 1)